MKTYTQEVYGKHSYRRGGLWAVGGAALIAALALGLYGQVSPLQIVALASGSSPDNVKLHLNGQNDVLQAELIFQPGGEAGWHTHPGPVVVVVKSGALTEIHKNGCMTVHPMGSAFYEEADVVHNVVNDTNGVTDIYATFMSPAGSQPLIPAANPGKVCRQ
jgi:quercetin dioxygenase-like cupin family protein